MQEIDERQGKGAASRERLEDCISFLIGKAAQRVTRDIREALDPWGVTPIQYAVLAALWDEDGQSGARIGQRLVLDSATITGVLDRLQKAGLVERSPDPGGDRRVNLIRLTARGRALEAPLGRCIAAYNAALREELGAEQAERLWQALRRLGGFAAGR
ncbi:transcriptional regulator, MarR family [Tistlia consotensis]|uniref:Transcriptional regulator, MarR family n=1 Tax=Tistlia consotensis USBA 355 TaxID=560819 RepID=A0A1Y6CMG4_9PROT|nr:MarR family transcriptional regulator [Tistlia consotensis]SMF76914.1 transcriptional regulator, MarR family [Tistlia consotensis USBA 355]SNS13417.1 transcriptional regulator, MarR family [Tistlia consotensis]